MSIERHESELPVMPDNLAIADDHAQHQSASSSSDSDSEDSNAGGGGGEATHQADADEDDLLLGIDAGAAPAEEDNGEIAVKKEKKIKDKKSKKDKDKKSKKDKDKKSKKDKDKKSKKDKHKKDKHKSKRDRDGDDDLEGYLRDAADDGVERRRRRRERITSHMNDAGDNNHDERRGKAADMYPKRGTTNVELRHMKALLEEAIIPVSHNEEGDPIFNEESLHEVLVNLAGLSVTYEQLVATRIGKTLGNLLLPEFHATMHAPFANGILRYWFSQLAEDRRRQLVRANELENASVASQFDDREEPEEMATLDRIGVDIEKMFTSEELDAAGVVDASHIAGELSKLLSKERDVREHVLNRLRAPDNKALRVKLLKGEVEAEELVNHPEVVGVSESQRRLDVAHEERYLRTHAM